jgi:hypothetical protein
MLSGYYKLLFFSKSDRIYFLVHTPEDSTYLLYDVNYTMTGVVKEESNYKNLLLFLAVTAMH